MAQSSAKRRMLYFFLAYVGIFGTLAFLGYLVAGKTQFDAASETVTHAFATDLAYYDLPRMTVEMGNGSTSRRVRIDISIEVAKKDIRVVQGYQPRMTANLNGFFLDLDPDRVQKASTLVWLHEEMLKQVNAAGSPAPIHDVFLRQMLIM